MKARKIKGKVIVGLRQHYDVHSCGERGVFVDAIICKDGTEIRPLARELEHGDGYGVELIVVKPKKDNP